MNVEIPRYLKVFMPGWLIALFAVLALFRKAPPETQAKVAQIPLDIWNYAQRRIAESAA